MIFTKGSVCPKCGGELQKRGSAIRYIRYGNGDRIKIRVKRYSCKKCGSWHTLIPDDILPYKQYSKKIVNGEVDLEDTQYENYPCDMTKKRWSRN